MIYLFEQFQLDAAKVELRSNGDAIAIEPQVFALLRFLLENRERVVTKDEIIERIWDGRIVSESAVASRIKSARQALGDDGRTQRFIRTTHGVGFRFVAEVAVEKEAASPRILRGDDAVAAIQAPPATTSRPSIAVLPFRLVGVAGPQSGIADALPDDLITELSRMHWLFVIARGSSFRFRGEEADIDRVRTALNVRYCLSGVVEILGNAMTVSVELCDTQDKGIVWSNRFRTDVGAVHEIREEIVRAVINALELQIPMNEARLARLKSPEHLDAWSAYHLGLHHMYRFNKADNALATSLFERAAAMEPGFARAYAGLSFTHFQDAFLRYADVSEAAKLAQHFAEQSLELDPVDPFGNFTMGRAFMLRGELDSSLPWLERATALSPNYAQARYSRGWIESMIGNPKTSQSDIDEALSLSPLDPLRYAMLSVRAFSHIVLGETAEAAEWAERSARSPGAHPLIEMIAVAAQGLNGNDASAKAWASAARARDPGLTTAEFFRAFPFRDPSARQRITKALEKFGF